MSEHMRKILYYENILEFKENTSSDLNLQDVKNWQLCRVCLSDANYDQFVDTRNVCVMQLDGKFGSAEDMLSSICDMKTFPQYMPHKICKICLKQITTFYIFKVQVNRATEVLERLQKKLIPKAILKSKRVEIHTTVNDADCSSSVNDDIHIENNVMKVDKVEKSFDNIEVTEYDKSQYDQIQEQNNFEIHDFEFEVIDGVTLDETHENNSNAEYEDHYTEEEDEQGGITENYNSDEKLVELQEDVSAQSSALEYNSPDTWRFEVLLDKDEKDPEFTIIQTPEESVKVPESRTSQKRKRFKSGTQLLESLECSICHQDFALQCQLIEHVQKNHPNEKAFRCRNCGNMFGHIQSLTRHMLTHKETATKNACAYCEKQFLRMDDMKRHMRTHTGERPYVCEICHKGFKQPSELKAHTLSHTKEKIFKCDQCSNRFSSRNGLYLHLKAHKGIKKYECNVCPKKFITNSELKSHIRSHMKSRPAAVLSSVSASSSAQKKPVRYVKYKVKKELLSSAKSE